MTVIRPNSISGITSITAQANEINVFRSDGTLAGLLLNGVNFNTTTGVSTFNNLDVGGVLTYQDVTNVDSVGIITARSTIDAQGAINLADSIVHTGDTNTKIRFPAADTFSVETGGTQGVRLTSAQKLLVGDHTSSRSIGHSEHILQTEGTNAGENGISIYAFNNSAHAGHFTFGKSRNNSTVADNDFLGHIIWSAHDGTDANSTAARITGRIDGTTGSNTTPGSLEFYTTPAGADNVTLRTIINSSGHVVPAADSTVSYTHLTLPTKRIV